MKCVKVYPAMRNDRRLQALTNAQRWVWFQLLCFAGEQPERGTIEARSERALAIEVSGGDAELLNKTLSALGTSGCIEVRLHDDGPAFQLRFTSFHECFSVSRGVVKSTERVRKHREKKRLREGNAETETKHLETRVSPPPSPPLASPSLPPPGSRFGSAHAREGSQGQGSDRQGHPDQAPPPIPRPPSPPRVAMPDDTPEGKLAILRSGDLGEPDPGPFDPTDGEVEAVFRLAWDLFDATTACAYFERQRSYSARAWRDALREAKRQKGDVIPPFRYIEAIAHNNPDGIQPKLSAGPGWKRPDELAPPSRVVRPTAAEYAARGYDPRGNWIGFPEKGAS